MGASREGKLCLSRIYIELQFSHCFLQSLGESEFGGYKISFFREQPIFFSYPRVFQGELMEPIN